MAAQYTREHLKVCVAKTCLTIGWHTSMTTPIEILTDILQNYLFQLSKATHEYANGCKDIILKNQNMLYLEIIFCSWNDYP